MTELKPCPFCGSHDIEIRQPIQDSWMFYCQQCHAAVQFLTCDCWGSTNHAAVRAWNRRAEVPQRIDGKPAGMSAEQFDACYEDDSDER